MPLFINVLTVFVELAVLLAGGAWKIKRDAVPQELHPGDSGLGLWAWEEAFSQARCLRLRRRSLPRR
ncbi:hypothetical protein HMPREF3039_01838 [Akkermansia sp. KLE1798]|nr:hypothetical protein HMPREF3039_01838 [Akkermansia sp. KLE1798]